MIPLLYLIIFFEDEKAITFIVKLCSCGPWKPWLHFKTKSTKKKGTVWSSINYNSPSRRVFPLWVSIHMLLLFLTVLNKICTFHEFACKSAATYASINVGKILHELKALESSFYEDHLNKKLLPRATLDNYWPAQPEENASVVFNYNFQFMAQFQQVFKSETRAFKWSFMPLLGTFPNWDF